MTLVDKLYEVIGVDKNRFDLELKVVYKCGGGDGIPIPPTKITTDSDLELWLEEMSYSIQHRTPLCVPILPKLCPLGEGCSQNASFVPETGAEKIDVEEVDPTPPVLATCPREVCIRDDNDNYYDWGFGAENMRPEELKEHFSDSVNLNTKDDGLSRAINEKGPATNRTRLPLSIPERGESS